MFTLEIWAHHGSPPCWDCSWLRFINNTIVRLHQLVRWAVRSLRRGRWARIVKRNGDGELDQTQRWRRIVTMSSEKFPIFNGVADELRPWISSMEVGTIKHNSGMFGALRRTSIVSEMFLASKVPHRRKRTFTYCIYKFSSQVLCVELSKAGLWSNWRQQSYGTLGWSLWAGFGWAIYWPAHSKSGVECLDSSEGLRFERS